ncbi:nuclear transport factor 2 family protein [Roseateles oligotrophus]|uniref:Nuclear transport factor 2 family protein n=1 Tax=Roseateles oligotrophus TaxID=1769250 RepID=A0ABT2YF51_9BURK|nr:nuclear transport factor 2 family protein [Roseateles oligotrophus]MCV2368649.1 nuclear transport factor 2 family protein [Roseateles oligotrophus]
MSTERIAFFIALETCVWQALTLGDVKAYKALLAPEFLGVYPSGFASLAENLTPFEQAPGFAPSYVLSEARIMELAPDLVMLSYKAVFQRVADAQAKAMYVSSLWRRQEGGNWVNIFSQDSLANAGTNEK